MNRSIFAGLVVVIVASLCMTNAQAYERRFERGYETSRSAVHYDRARVVAVRPIRQITRTAIPRQVCHHQQVQRSYREGADPGAYMITGTIIGGVLGNQIGRGSGRKAATVAGTALGAVIGHDMGRERGHAQVHEYYPQRHCYTEHRYLEEEHIVAYRVTYVYRGREYTQEMDYDPGPYVQVRVNVAPLH